MRSLSNDSNQNIILSHEQSMLLANKYLESNKRDEMLPHDLYVERSKPSFGSFDSQNQKLQYVDPSLSSPRRLLVAPEPQVEQQPYTDGPQEDLKNGAKEAPDRSSEMGSPDLKGICHNQDQRKTTLSPKETTSEGCYPYQNIQHYATRNSNSQSTNGELSTSLNTYVRIQETQNIVEKAYGRTDGRSLAMNVHTRNNSHLCTLRNNLTTIASVEHENGTASRSRDPSSELVRQGHGKDAESGHYNAQKASINATSKETVENDMGTISSQRLGNKIDDLMNEQAKAVIEKQYKQHVALNCRSRSSASYMNSTDSKQLNLPLKQMHAALNVESTSTLVNQNSSEYLPTPRLAADDNLGSQRSDKKKKTEMEIVIEQRESCQTSKTPFSEAQNDQSQSMIEMNEDSLNALPRDLNGLHKNVQLTTNRQSYQICSTDSTRVFSNDISLRHNLSKKVKLIPQIQRMDSQSLNQNSGPLTPLNDKRFPLETETMQTSANEPNMPPIRYIESNFSSRPALLINPSMSSGLQTAGGPTPANQNRYKQESNISNRLSRGYSKDQLLDHGDSQDKSQKSPLAMNIQYQYQAAADYSPDAGQENQIQHSGQIQSNRVLGEVPRNKYSRNSKSQGYQTESHRHMPQKDRLNLFSQHQDMGQARQLLLPLSKVAPAIHKLQPLRSNRRGKSCILSGSDPQGDQKDDILYNYNLKVGNQNDEGGLTQKAKLKAAVINGNQGIHVNASHKRSFIGPDGLDEQNLAAEEDRNWSKACQKEERLPQARQSDFNTVKEATKVTFYDGDADKAVKGPQNNEELTQWRYHKSTNGQKSSSQNREQLNIEANYSDCNVHIHQEQMVQNTIGGTRVSKMSDERPYINMLDHSEITNHDHKGEFERSKGQQQDQELNAGQKRAIKKPYESEYMQQRMTFIDSMPLAQTPGGDAVENYDGSGFQMQPTRQPSSVASYNDDFKRALDNDLVSASGHRRTNHGVDHQSQQNIEILAQQPLGINDLSNQVVMIQEQQDLQTNPYNTFLSGTLGASGASNFQMLGTMTGAIGQTNGHSNELSSSKGANAGFAMQNRPFNETEQFIDTDDQNKQAEALQYQQNSPTLGTRRDKTSLCYTESIGPQADTLQKVDRSGASQSRISDFNKLHTYRKQQADQTPGSPPENPYSVSEETMHLHQQTQEISNLDSSNRFSNRHGQRTYSFAPPTIENSHRENRRENYAAMSMLQPQNKLSDQDISTVMVNYDNLSNLQFLPPPMRLRSSDAIRNEVAFEDNGRQQQNAQRKPAPDINIRDQAGFRTSNNSNHRSFENTATTRSYSHQNTRQFYRADIRDHTSLKPPLPSIQNEQFFNGSQTYKQHHIADNISQLTLSNSTMQQNLSRPPKDPKIVTSSTTGSFKNPMVLDTLKAELLSCKRQLKDQQSSNQFLKKEKLKAEHEKNMGEIQIRQAQEKIERLQTENEALNKLGNHEQQELKAQYDNQSRYIEELHKMNDLQSKEAGILRSKLYRLEDEAVKQIDKLNSKATDQKLCKQRNLDKVVSQVMQLGSAATHLKDLIRLAELGTQNEDHQSPQQNKIINYVELNLENTVKNILRLTQGETKEQSRNQDRTRLIAVRSDESIQIGQIGTESTETISKTELMTMNNQNFNSDKIKIRAQNFKKFRQSTQDLIKQLFDKNMKGKVAIINDLENQIIASRSQVAAGNEAKDQEIKYLSSQMESYKQKYFTADKTKKKLEDETVPQLQEKVRMESNKLKDEYNLQEDAFQSKIIKQKYQIKEYQEKEKMMQNESDRLKLEKEALRCKIEQMEKWHQSQVASIQVQNQILQQQSQGREMAGTRGRTQHISQEPQVQRRTNSHDDFLQGAHVTPSNSTQSLLAETSRKQQQKLVKNQKKMKIQEYYHQKEKKILGHQIEQYRDTVTKQAELIQELQKKLWKHNQASCQLLQQNTTEGTLSENTFRQQQPIEMQQVYKIYGNPSQKVLLNHNQLENPGIIYHQSLQPSFSVSKNHYNPETISSDEKLEPYQQYASEHQYQARVMNSMQPQHLSQDTSSYLASEHIESFNKKTEAKQQQRQEGEHASMSIHQYSSMSHPSPLPAYGYAGLCDNSSIQYQGQEYRVFGQPLSALETSTIVYPTFQEMNMQEEVNAVQHQSHPTEELNSTHDDDICEELEQQQQMISDGMYRKGPTAQQALQEDEQQRNQMNIHDQDQQIEQAYGNHLHVPGHAKHYPMLVSSDTSGSLHSANPNFEVNVLYDNSTKQPHRIAQKNNEYSQNKYANLNNLKTDQFESTEDPLEHAALSVYKIMSGSNSLESVDKAHTNTTVIQGMNRVCQMNQNEDNSNKQSEQQEIHQQINQMQQVQMVKMRSNDQLQTEVDQLQQKILKLEQRLNTNKEGQKSCSVDTQQYSAQGGNPRQLVDSCEQVEYCASRVTEKTEIVDTNGIAEKNYEPGQVQQTFEKYQSILDSTHNSQESFNKDPMPLQSPGFVQRNSSQPLVEY